MKNETFFQNNYVRLVLVLVVAVLASLMISFGIVNAYGLSFADALSAFMDGAWGSPYVIGSSINRALYFALIGLGFILADQAKLANIGAEGQLAVGGIMATALCLYGGASALPSGLAFLYPLAGAVLAGAFWGAIAGFLKAKMGTNEVISTLLLSFIAVWLLYCSVQSDYLLKQPMTTSASLPQSLPIPENTMIPAIFANSGYNLNLGLVIALILAVIVYAVIHYSRFGFYLRSVGHNQHASKRAGIPVFSTIVIVMAISGGFAGLAGGLMLQGDQQVLKSGFSSGYGFDGLVVGLLARGSVLGVFTAALVFGFLRSGGINLELVAQVPSAMVLAIQGLIILIIAGAARWLGRQGA
ncbi:ABC transporter permease [Acinetobacter bouvetii]|uniref:Ribose ABC transporter permease protein n=1 Tax=Acinetobacter bouvetii TaxID=202951 RepID=A0A811GF86_9GAMM|nr:ABC transporter permease [Acinetobacter bouvetii]CAB1221628.1 ribose ABC transporter permease protein [Acinetobacter bouvetii]